MNAHKCDMCTRRAFERFGPVYLCHECLRPFLTGFSVGRAFARDRDEVAESPLKHVCRYCWYGYVSDLGDPDNVACYLSRSVHPSDDTCPNWRPIRPEGLI